MDGSQDVPEVGYWIARGYRGKGYASEALDGLLGIARSLGIRRLQAGHYVDNPASGAVLRKRLSITGSTLRARSVEYKGELARALRQSVWPLLEAGQFKPVIHQVFDAAQAAQAHALMESSTHVGKIVLRWNA